MLASALPLWSGCETKSSGAISGERFLTVRLAGEPATAMRQLTTQLELLRAITPSARVDELENQTAITVPQGKVTTERLVVYESQRGATVSVDICRDCARTGERSEVALHYTRDGFEQELLDVGAVGASLNLDVKPVEVELGGHRWLVAFENASRSIIAFRYDPDFRPVPEALGELSSNFGRGNGLILNVVVSGVEVQRQLLQVAAPVTQLAPYGPGKLLVYFSNVSTVRAVHLLDLEVDQEEIDWDLDSGTGATRPTDVLDGTFRVFEDPLDPNGPPLGFVGFDEIRDITERTIISVDEMASIVVPTDGSALSFDEESSYFLRYVELDALPGELGEGEPIVAVEGLKVRQLAGSNTLVMRETWYHDQRPSIIITEQVTNAIFEYNYETGGLSIFTDPADVLTPRDPQADTGGIIPGAGEAPELVAGYNDIHVNRLVFDRGRDQLLAVSYTSGVPVVVVRREQFFPVTGRELADVVFLESVTGAGTTDTEDVRGWDSGSNSLLAMSFDEISLPVTVTP